MRVLMLMYAYISINIEQILARCARSSLTLTRAVQRPAMLQCTGGGVNSLALALTAAFCGANQHNHGLLVSWALQGEGMACAPWYVRQRLRRASGRCGSCAAWYFRSPLPSAYAD